jgi:hypothetical protein
VELLHDRVLFSIGHQNIDEPSAIVAVDKDSGKRAWVAHHSARICGRFAVASGRAFAATQDRKVLGIVLLDGAAAFSSDLPKADRGEFAGITLDNGSFFLAGADGTVSRMSLNSISNSSR